MLSALQPVQVVHGTVHDMLVSVPADATSPPAVESSAAAGRDVSAAPTPPQTQPSPPVMAAPNHATDPVLENFSGARTPSSGAMPGTAASLPQAASRALQQQQQQQAPPQQQQPEASAPLPAAPSAGGVVITPEIIEAVMAHLHANGGAVRGDAAAAPLAPPPQAWQAGNIGGSAPHMASSAQPQYGAAVGQQPSQQAQQQVSPCRTSASSECSCSLTSSQQCETHWSQSLSGFAMLSKIHEHPTWLHGAQNPMLWILSLI